MKLQEIFEPELSQVKMNNGAIHRGILPPKTPDELGRGIFSRVTTHADDPHLITKYQMRSNDGYIRDLFNEYAEIIALHKLWNLIHFPRVYAIKKIVDDAGNSLHEWKIEKLVPLSAVSKNDIESLSERYFSPKIIRKLVDEKYHISEFCYVIERSIQYEKWDNFVDDTLREAGKVLYEIYKVLDKKYPYNVSFDLHEDNIMFRRTHTGLELVFSDPFAG